jgi:hypothetical protein
MGPTWSRRRPGRRFAIATGTVLASLVATYLVAGALVWDRLARVGSACGEDTPAAFTWDDLDTGPYLMPDYEEVSFPSRDPRITVSGWYVPSASGPAGPAVVVVHGLYGCKRQAGFSRRQACSTGMASAFC